MAYNYKGTKITGTSTTAKIFKKSGVSDAKKNQTYFNTATGHVYTCDTAGGPSKAKWKYTRTDIAKKPSLEVKNLGAPARTASGSNTYLMKTSWKVPSGMTNTKKGDRAESLTIDWWLGIPGKKNKDPKKVKANVGTGATESTINLKNFIVGSKTYTRESFYPFKGKPNLSFVTVGVKAHNSKGNGPEAKETRKFTKPKAPVIGAWEFDTEHGEAKTVITTDAGTGYAERYDTWYTVTVTDTHTGKTFTHRDTSSTATSINVSYDAPDYRELNYDEYIKVEVDTYARGFAGASDHADKRTTYYISYPAQATITGINISGKTPSDKCTVKIKTNHTAEHPVDQVRLGYMANTDYAAASDIPGDADWTWTDIIDDNTCTALAMPVGNLLPERGKHTWVCVKTFHANEDVLFRYSDFQEVKAVYTPAATAADDDITILSATPGADGQSAVVQLGWNKDGQDDSTGTELTWSDELDTWKSTDEPDSHEFTWSDGAITVDNVTYHDSANIVIKGLNEGVTYYVKARRYLEGDTTTYSDYSNTATVIPNEKPESIVATADRYVPEDGSLMVWWTFSGNGLQRAWQVVKRVQSGGEWVDDAVIADGEGSIGATQISAERLATFTDSNGSLTYNVQASTGSGFVSSENQTVTIIEPPTLEITGSSLVHAHSEDEQTYTGDIISVDNTNGVLGVKSVLTTIEPIQSGSGTPSPDNVRPISGHTECNVYVSPTTSATDATTYTTDLGRTVYGGTLDVVSGVLTVTMAMVDLGTLTWTANGSFTNTFNGALTIDASTPGYQVTSNCLCEQYERFLSTEVGTKDAGFALSNNGSTVYVRDIRYSDTAAFKSAMSGVKLVYEVATPQTYQLTPTEVELLLGQNNLWTDCGETTLTTIETLTDEDQLQTNDLSISFKSNQLCDLITIVTSQGASGQFPQGILRQTEGDTIHSDVYSAEWTEVTDGFTSTIDLPTGLDFWDGGRYTATVTAVDRQSGLKSEPTTLDMAVAWEHQAPIPFDAVTLTPLNYTDDENDMHHQAVQIDLTPPTGSAETDMYDIYRLTGDGAKLIGESFPLTSQATDEYAPFGDDITCYYRIALRTADGDVEFSDIEYNLDGSAMRFDWSGGTLELPYNLSIADSYKKDVDIRKHMDGSTDGYWNRNIERKGKLSSDAIRLEQQDEITAARHLARYPGAVFVRTPDGSAYEADVQVSDLSTGGVMTAIAIDAQEIGLTQEFILPTPYPLED